MQNYYITQCLIENTFDTYQHLSTADKYHGWIEHAFPNDLNSSTRIRHLWRLESYHNQNQLLIISKTKPNYQELNKFAIPESIQTRDYTPLLQSIQQGQILRFHYTGNPFSRTVLNKHNHHYYYKYFDQARWINQLGKRHGFDLLTTGTAYEPRPALRTLRETRIPVYHNKKFFRLYKVNFDGLLRVSNVADFQHALTNGMGREKCFGFGMLTISSPN